MALEEYGLPQTKYDGLALMIGFGLLCNVKFCISCFVFPKIDDENFGSRDMINFCNMDQTFPKRTNFEDDQVNGQVHAKV